MSEKSKPSTGAQAELSKISETSSRALMGSNLSGPGGAGLRRSLAQQAAHRTRDAADDVADRPGHRVQHLAHTALRGRLAAAGLRATAGLAATGLRAAGLGPAG